MLLSLESKYQSKYDLQLIYVPVSMGLQTRFKWIMQDKWSYPVSIKELVPQMVKRRSFQEKAEWFRLRLEDRKVSWRKGCEKIFVDRQNILTSSFQQLSKLTITKQIKVNFTDQKGQSDAGGIFREWLNLCMKEIFQNKPGLMSLCQTHQTYYKLNINEKYFKQCQNTASLLGYLIAKALMERVPINCHLNHTIWRHILQQRITIDDIYTYDKDFYKNWKYILENQGIVEALALNFTVLVKDEITKRSKTFSLCQNGKTIQVSENNKEDYIKGMIQVFCVKIAMKAIYQIKKSLYEIIPVELLAVFQPHQIDCLLCGQETIDVKDWKKNTEYQGYKQTDQIIGWFWKVMDTLEQPMLKNMLHYCTGCSRVPVSGFIYLQSNRGQIRKFNIKRTAVDTINPYPRSYTCFNRLQLPQYSTFDELSIKILAICYQEINQMNIDA